MFAWRFQRCTSVLEIGPSSLEAMALTFNGVPMLQQGRVPSLLVAFSASQFEETEFATQYE